MAEQEAETTVETEQEAVETAPETGDKPDKQKALLADLAKERRARQAAEKRLQDIDNANKTELQKAQERAEAAEKAAQSHEASALRLSVAFEKGLTPAQAKRLVGGSREELEADADEILRDFPTNTGSSRPAPIDQGPRGGRPPQSNAQMFGDLLKHAINR